MANVPPMKAPAGIYLKPGAGRPSPKAGGVDGAFMFGPFGDLAFLLAHLEPEGGDEFWIESPAGRISHSEIKAEFAAGRIQRVN